MGSCHDYEESTENKLIRDDKDKKVNNEFYSYYAVFEEAFSGQYEQQSVWLTLEEAKKFKDSILATRNFMILKKVSEE